jgi:hypothetical protein
LSRVEWVRAGPLRASTQRVAVRPIYGGRGLQRYSNVPCQATAHLNRCVFERSLLVERGVLVERCVDSGRWIGWECCVIVVGGSVVEG